MDAEAGDKYGSAYPMGARMMSGHTELHDQLQEGDSLLICAKKFQPECANRFGNISLKKIPQMLLGKCEFAKDDYSLNIINLPQEDDINETEEDFDNE